MACNKCNLSKCGCADSYLTTPPPCPTPSDCAEAQPCSEVFSAECVLYTGLPITCGDVDVVITNTPISDAITSIVSFFCDQLAVNEDVVCGEDIVIPADTSLEDALPLIVDYFCSNLITDIVVNQASTVDPETDCVTTLYTVSNNNGTGELADTLSSFQFSVGPICPPTDEPCDAPIVNELNVTDQTSDSIIICRDVEGVQTTVKIPWVDFRIQRQPWAYFYTANLSQEALLDPVAQVPPDVIGLVGNLNINWTRVGVGIYHGTSVGKFVGVTICSITQGMFGFPQPGIIQFSNNGTDRVEIHTFNASGVYTDSIIRSASVDIKVYPV